MMFSIVMPVYNAGRYLRSALDSVVKQTFPDWELICVDDGSSDSSGTILRNRSAGDARIKVVEKQNSGPGAARNSALEIAAGEWIVFLDADDCLSPNALEVIAHLANDADIVRFAKEDFEVDRPSIVKSYDSAQVQYSRLDCVSKSEFDCALWQYAYKRTLIGETRFASYVRGEDKLFQLLCLDKARTLARISMSLYYYRQNSASLTHSGISFRALHDELQWRLDWFKYLREAGTKPVDDRVFKRQGIFLMEQLPVQTQLLDGSEKKMLQEKWYSALPSFSILPFGLLQRCVLTILRLLPKSDFCIKLFCGTFFACRRFASRFTNWHPNQ